MSQILLVAVRGLQTHDDAYSTYSSGPYLVLYLMSGLTVKLYSCSTPSVKRLGPQHRRTAAVRTSLGRYDSVDNSSRQSLQHFVSDIAV